MMSDDDINSNNNISNNNNDNDYNNSNNNETTNARKWTHIHSIAKCHRGTHCPTETIYNENQE